MENKKTDPKLVAEKINKVIASLEKVPDETKRIVLNISMNMSELDIIQAFNQQSRDLFDILDSITKKYDSQRDYKIDGYKMLFNNALKHNVKMPVDKFTLTILEFASDIYAENEDCFLNMKIPDTKVSVGNEFNFIRSEMFKSMWKAINGKDREILKDKVILLTTYAHAYFYKTVLATK